MTAGTKIFIPILQEYYIFDYFKYLIPKLVSCGFHVTVFVFYEKDCEKYKVDSPNFEFRKASWFSRQIFNSQSTVIGRFVYWCWIKAWSQKIKNSYRYAILPWDTRPLWYQLSKVMPCATLSTTTTMIDRDLHVQDHFLHEDEKNGLAHKAYKIFDGFFGNLVPSYKGVDFSYNKKLRWIDYIFGMRPLYPGIGASQVIDLYVPGQEIADIISDAGVDAAKISVVGMPNYEFLADFKADFSEEKKAEILSGLGFASQKRLFSFFLSPSSFTDEMLQEVLTVVRTIRGHYEDSAFLLKFHPKTVTGDPERFRDALDDLGDDLLIMQEYTGDLQNAEIIAASHAIVQKQSTVGFIAFLLRVPVLSYNLFCTDYCDRMYEILNGSFHATDIGSLKHAVEALDDPEALAELELLQEKACERFCRDEESPCGLIVNLIENRLNELPKSTSSE